MHACVTLEAARRGHDLPSLVPDYLTHLAAYPSVTLTQPQPSTLTATYGGPPLPATGRRTAGATANRWHHPAPLHDRIGGQGACAQTSTYHMHAQVHAPLNDRVGGQGRTPTLTLTLALTLAPTLALTHTHTHTSRPSPSPSLRYCPRCHGSSKKRPLSRPPFAPTHSNRLRALCPRPPIGPPQVPALPTAALQVEERPICSWKRSSLCSSHAPMLVARRLCPPRLLRRSRPRRRRPRPRHRPRHRRRLRRRPPQHRWNPRHLLGSRSPSLPRHRLLSRRLLSRRPPRRPPPLLMMTMVWIQIHTTLTMGVARRWRMVRQRRYLWM